MRPLIQYDLDEPPLGPSAPSPNIQHSRPMKKRKRNHHTQNSAFVPPVQHWDDPGSTAVGVVYDDGGSTSVAAGSIVMSYAEDEQDEHGEERMDEDEGVNAEQEEGEEEESRPLTHEEIWDDSALVDAWNSAEAEYEAYHGTSKTWKTEPVKRSPLWYNKPYTAPPPKPRSSKPKLRSKHTAPQAQSDSEEPDTAPLDFNTYVPTYDPSLAGASAAAATATTAPSAFFVPPLSTTVVSRDEAFQNALSAMYWGGYWTAVYHCQSRTNGESNNGPANATEEGTVEVDENEEDGDEEDLVPAQR